MKEELLQRVLSCRTLPSLPAVALRVIELTGNPNVRISELAETIQNDQGLAAKILKTVNSSFYGLRQPCATINKALVMLGLSPVKTLALGFSLVSSVNSNNDTQFDFVAYWRRGLYTAVAAKAIAEAARRPWADEVFLAGLLQDIGVMALYRALGRDYLAVMEKAGRDHRLLVKYELADLETQHPEVGAMLAERWKLPQELVLPVRYHERPTAAPGENADLARCVGLSNIVHDAMTTGEPDATMCRMYERAEAWFLLDHDAMNAVFRRVAEGSKELSRLFSLDTGSGVNADDLLAKAASRKAEIEAAEKAQRAAGGMASLLTGATDTDPLTGVKNRSTFELSLQRVVNQAKCGGSHAALAYICIDRFKDCCHANGMEAADEVVVRAASLLRGCFSPIGAEAFRLRPETLAVLGVESTTDAFRSALESFRREFLLSDASGVPVTLSAGLAVLRTGDPVELVTAASKALQAAVAGGGNRVVEHGNAIAA